MDFPDDVHVSTAVNRELSLEIEGETGDRRPSNLANHKRFDPDMGQPIAKGTDQRRSRKRQNPCIDDTLRPYPPYCVPASRRSDAGNPACNSMRRRDGHGGQRRKADGRWCGFPKASYPDK
jgi:hypothetical protein